MEKIDINRIKQIQLEIMMYIEKICKDNNLKYCMAYGTMLGAVRHKGYIPWDDDIDIIIPREDYNKLIEIFKKNETEKYKMANIYTDEKWGYLFSKIYDSTTILVENVTNRKNNSVGVFIDVFPIDNLGKNKTTAICNFNKDRVLREILIAANWSKFTRSKVHKIYYEPIRLVLYIIGRLFDPNKLAIFIDKRINNLCDSKYVGNICGPYRKKEIFEKEILVKYELFEFEDMKFVGISNYDKYLNQLYGDYTKYPPIEERNTHHTFEAYEL